MTKAEVNKLIRPYILRKEREARQAMYPCILAFLILGILASAGFLMLVMLLNYR